MGGGRDVKTGIDLGLERFQVQPKWEIPDYTHREDTGKRVAQYAKIAPVYTTPRADFVQSAYRHSRIRIGVGSNVDNTHIVEEWGRQVRPYGEWQRPYRPYSVPYDQWAPPYYGMFQSYYGRAPRGRGPAGPGRPVPGRPGPGGPGVPRPRVP